LIPPSIASSIASFANGAGTNIIEVLAPVAATASLTVLKNCYVESCLKDAKAYDSFQFVRNGFFCVDAKDSRPDALVFNRIVSLKSSFKLVKND